MDGLFVEFHPQKRGRPRKFKPSDLLDEFQNYIQDKVLELYFKEKKLV